MAQVTSPILLDSTGQSIVTKLDDIKTAIENQSGGGGGGGSSVSVSINGTASSTTTAAQQVVVDSTGYDINRTKYMQQNVTFSTSSSTVCTFTNAAITTESIIEVFTNGGDDVIPYDSLVVSAGVATITFPIQTSAFTAVVRIYIS